MAKIAYIRVSTTEQNVDRQLDGLTFDKVFQEKVGARAKLRPQFDAMLDYIREGDEVHAHQLSRIARSVVDLNRIVKTIRAKGADLFIHKENLAFYANSAPSAMENLNLNLLSSIAQFEIELLKEVQAEGIAQAKKAGKYKGKQSKFTKDRLTNFAKEWENYKDNGMTRTQIAKNYGISLHYGYSLYNKQKKQK